MDIIYLSRIDILNIGNTFNYYIHNFELGKSMDDSLRIINKKKKIRALLLFIPFTLFYYFNITYKMNNVNNCYNKILHGKNSFRKILNLMA